MTTIIDHTCDNCICLPVCLNKTILELRYCSILCNALHNIIDKQIDGNGSVTFYNATMNRHVHIQKFSGSDGDNSRSLYGWYNSMKDNRF
jgi:hypothetical protein